MFDCKKLLVVSPHADDEVLWSGGLISYAKRNNMDVHVLYFSYTLIATDDVVQSTGAHTYRDLRKKEIQNVADFCGFTYEVIEHDRQACFPALFEKRMVDAVEDVVKKYQPDVVCLPRRNSFNQDHRLVFNSAITALRPFPREMRNFVKLVLECEEGGSWGIEGDFSPNFYVPLTQEDMDNKIKSISLHASQLRPDPFTRSIENMLRLAQVRGTEVGTKYAEAFKLVRAAL